MQGSVLQLFVNNKGNYQPEIQRRMPLARTAYSFPYSHCMRDLNGQKIERTTHLCIEMWTWRRLLRIPWTTCRTNVSVNTPIKLKHLLSNTVFSRILKFFGHIHRREYKIELLLVQGKALGQRPHSKSPQC